ncbi:MAG: (d)CMP kinase [Clostridiales bacterium]|nr:(d)CMP kinase [Clostridiales bacterium]
MRRNTFNIAIDGPAGAGKSTIAKLTAKRLGFVYVDTGAMYRAIALYMLRGGIDPADGERVCAAVAGAQITICHEEGAQQVLLNGENVTGEIRTEEVGAAASKVSAYPPVRQHLTGLQRSLAAAADVIMDGRDIGTCILPDADAKIYLTADAGVRARRRVNELRERGIACDPEEIERDIIRRDEQDMSRETAPLRMAEDAVRIDSSTMTIAEVVDAIIRTAVAHGLEKQAEVDAG